MTVPASRKRVFEESSESSSPPLPSLVPKPSAAKKMKNGLFHRLFLNFWSNYLVDYSTMPKLTPKPAETPLSDPEVLVWKNIKYVNFWNIFNQIIVRKFFDGVNVVNKDAAKARVYQ